MVFACVCGLCSGLCLLFAYRLHWFVLCAMICYVALFLMLVCMICLWRVVLLVVLFIGLSCVYALLVFCFVFGVLLWFECVPCLCDCILYVHYCGVLFFLCDGVCLFMCLWYGLCLLFACRCHWFCVRCYASSLSVLFLFVCLLCLWCVVLLLAVSSVCRACVALLCVSVLLCCYCLNDSPVRDCVLYVPPLRWSSLLV